MDFFSSIYSFLYTRTKEQKFISNKHCQCFQKEKQNLQYLRQALCFLESGFWQGFEVSWRQIIPRLTLILKFHKFLQIGRKQLLLSFSLWLPPDACPIPGKGPLLLLFPREQLAANFPAWKSLSTFYFLHLMVPEHVYCTICSVK